MTTIKQRWLALADDGSRPAAEVAEAVGGSQGYIANLRREYGTSAPQITGKVISAWRRSEGLTQREVADAVGVHFSTVSKWETEGTTMPEAETRRALAGLGCWVDRPEQADREEVRCPCCTAMGDEKIPIVDEEIEQRLRRVLRGEPRDVREGLCLWCWLRAQGADLKTFYTSGAWQQVIDWRPAGNSLADLRAAVKTAMADEGATYRGVSEATGIPMITLDAFFRDGRTVRWDQDMLEALCRYAGVDVASYEDLLEGRR